MDDINKIIAPQIDYSYLNNNVRCELVSRMKVNVCPYCNRTYIQPIIIDNKKRYTGDVVFGIPLARHSLTIAVHCSQRALCVILSIT